jgi:hypothetical protein
MSEPASTASPGVREDRTMWELAAASSDTQPVPSDVNVVFRQQPKPVDARHRVAYRTALLVVILARFNQRAATLASLHTVMWATRSARTRRMFRAWWDGRRAYNTVTERIDPDLEITLNLALVDGLVAPKGTRGRIQLTDKGHELARLIDEETTLLAVEKAFLRGFDRLSDSTLVKKLGVVPQ